MGDLKVTALYAGDTDNFRRFKFHSPEVNLRLYLRKGRELPDRVVIDLRQAKKKMRGPRVSDSEASS